MKCLAFVLIMAFYISNPKCIHSFDQDMSDTVLDSRGFENK